MRRAAQDPGSLTPRDVLQLQRAVGNRASGKILASAASPQPIQRKENRTGLPDALKSGVENLSGLSLDDVKVHYNSAEPSLLNALAYTQGTDIHVGPGQEEHLPHEAWHVVQQKRGRVRPTLQMRGVELNEDDGLESEAEVFGERAASVGARLAAGTGADPAAQLTSRGGDPSPSVVQRVKEKKVKGRKVKYAESEEEADALCKVEAARYKLNEWSDDEEAMVEREYAWETDVSASARGHIKRVAQTAADEGGVPAGLPEAYNMILEEHRSSQKKENKKERAHLIADDYAELVSNLGGNAILTAVARWMKDDYVAGVTGKVNHSLGGTYTRAVIATAVGIWNGLGHWLPDRDLTHVSGMHGYEVGPKDAQVGDTLDRRGDQGNIIATWGSAKINIHLNPSD